MLKDKLKVIIDQLVEFYTKKSEIFFPTVSFHPEEKNKSIPIIPVMVYRPSSAQQASNTNIAASPASPNATGVRFWVSATEKANQESRLKVSVFRKFAKRFRTGGAKSKGRSA